jgi:hypothetical protein
MHATGENNERSEPFAMFKKVLNCRHLFIGVLAHSPMGSGVNGQPYRLAQVGTSPITAARNSWVNFVRSNNLKPHGNPEYVQLGIRTIVKVNLKQNNKMVTRLYLSGSGTFRVMSGVFPSWNEVPIETLAAITEKPTNWYHRQLPVYGMQLLRFDPDAFRSLPEEDKTDYLQINQNPDQKRSVAEMLTARLSKLKPTAPPPASPKKPAAPTIQTGPVNEIAPILASINANQNRFVQTLAQANEALNTGITPNPAIAQYAQQLAGIQAKQAIERANLAKKIEQGRQEHDQQLTQIANSFAASMQVHLDNIITDYLNPNSMTHKMLANSQQASVKTGRHTGTNIPIQLLDGSDRNTIFGQPFSNVPYYLSQNEYSKLLKTLNTDQQLQATPTVGIPLGEEPPKGTSFIKPKPSETGTGGVDKHGPLTPTNQTTPGAQRPTASTENRDPEGMTVQELKDELRERQSQIGEKIDELKKVNLQITANRAEVIATEQLIVSVEDSYEKVNAADVQASDALFGYSQTYYDLKKNLTDINSTINTAAMHRKQLLAILDDKKSERDIKISTQLALLSKNNQIHGLLVERARAQEKLRIEEIAVADKQRQIPLETTNANKEIIKNAEAQFAMLDKSHADLRVNLNRLADIAIALDETQKKLSDDIHNVSTRIRQLKWHISRREPRERT